MNICIYGSYSKNQEEKLLNISKEIGKTLCRNGHNLIYGGGKNGLLGEIAKTVNKLGRDTIGIILETSDMDNYVYKKCTKLIKKKNMSERKHYMEEISDGFIILPGGIGTLDEFFEILVLINKGEYQKPVALFNKYGFFNDILSFMKMIENKGMMNKKIFDLFYVTDDIDKMFSYLENYKLGEKND